MATEHEHTDPAPLSEEELERQEADELPDREVMTILPVEGTAGFKVLPLPPEEF